MARPAELTRRPTWASGGDNPPDAVVRKGSGGLFTELGDEGRLARHLPVYRKVRAIGRGAFGKAYLVEDGVAHRQRVLKKMPLKGISEAQREAAINEAQLMRKISHGCPFITQFSEVLLGQKGTQLCIVMEYCSGGDLRHMLRERNGERLPEAQVLEWIAQVALALEHCHRHGVLHRDVKPENCFFRTAGGTLLLGDFGISCTLDTKSFAKSCVGSPLYLSPEVVNQDPYSYTTDVWSLGVMLYEVAMLEPPFKGTNICQIAFKIVGAEPAPIDGEAFSQPLQHLVRRLLEKEPQRRATLEEALSAPPLYAAAVQAARSCGVDWQPGASCDALESSSASRSGLVGRLRGHIATSGLSPADGAAHDAADDAAEDAAYHDDFEEASESDASYASDFEALSDGERSPAPDLSEARVRQQLREEFGEEALAAAEIRGVVSFLGGIGLSSQGPAGTPLGGRQGLMMR